MIMPVIDIYANVDGRDLGAVSNAVARIIKDMQSSLPRGATVSINGQATTMHSAYAQLLAGLALSIVLIYLVIVVNFQSWLDPFIIISALPAALGGIAWSLFLTNTTLSVPALTGAIMCMGTATANTILVVAFARDHLREHGDPVGAAIEAGYARIRPVLMTALAMIVGMLPMSFSNTQNAPLGRAVIGGLLVATVTTLLFVPCVFAILHGGKSSQQKPAHRGRRHMTDKRARTGASRIAVGAPRCRCRRRARRLRDLVPQRNGRRPAERPRTMRRSPGCRWYRPNPVRGSAR